MFLDRPIRRRSKSTPHNALIWTIKKDKHPNQRAYCVYLTYIFFLITKKKFSEKNVFTKKHVFGPSDKTWIQINAAYCVDLDNLKGQTFKKFFFIYKKNSPKKRFHQKTCFHREKKVIKKKHFHQENIFSPKNTLFTKKHIFANHFFYCL